MAKKLGQVAIQEMTHVSLGPLRLLGNRHWRAHTEILEILKRKAASGDSWSWDTWGGRCPAGPQGRLSPHSWVKHHWNQTRMPQSWVPGLFSCSHPHFLWPRSPSVHSGCRNQQADFRPQTLQGTCTSTLGPPDQYTERPEKASTFQLHLKTLTVTLTLKYWFLWQCAPCSARLPPSSFASFPSFP